MYKIKITISLLIIVNSVLCQNQKINADYIFDTLYCKRNNPIIFSNIYVKVEKNLVITSDSSVNIKCAKYHTIKSEKKFLKILKRDSIVDYINFYEVKTLKKKSTEKIINVQYLRATYKGYKSSPKLFKGNSEPISIKVKIDSLSKRWVITEIKWWDNNFQY